MTWGEPIWSARLQVFMATTRRKSSHRVNDEQMAGSATAAANKETTKVFRSEKLTGSVDDLDVPRARLRV